MLTVGQIVKIKNSLGKTRVVGNGNIVSISKTGKVVVVDDPRMACPIRFYRDDRAGSDRKTYIANPGAGILGHAFNDFFEAV